MNRRTIIKALAALPFVGNVLASSEPTSANKYAAVMAVFPEGTWVAGTDRHVGCSFTFDYDHPDRPQPFAYLNETDPNQFRVATEDEKEAGMALFNGKG